MNWTLYNELAGQATIYGTETHYPWHYFVLPEQKVTFLNKRSGITRSLYLCEEQIRAITCGFRTLDKLPFLAFLLDD